MRNAITYRAMKREDIELALAGFEEQLWDKPRKVLETYFNEQEQGNVHQQITAVLGELFLSIHLYHKNESLSVLFMPFPLRLLTFLPFYVLRKLRFISF
jgi:hypothetical protein